MILSRASSFISSSSNGVRNAFFKKTAIKDRFCFARIFNYEISKEDTSSVIKMVDSKGILNADRIDVKGDKNKWGICKKTNKGGRSGDIKVTMRDSDVCIALSTSWSRHHKARMGGRYSGRFFPVVLRGALDVPATRIIDDMYVREAVAVGMNAVGQGLAERKMSIEELDAVVREKIFEVE